MPNRNKTTSTAASTLPIVGLMARQAIEDGQLRNLIIFDGECGFCTWSIAKIVAVNGGRMTVAPFQWLSDAALSSVGATRDGCSQAIHYVSAAGRLSTGAEAMNDILRSCPRFSGLVEAVERWSLLIGIERRAYRFIARNRVALSRVIGTARYALIDDEHSGGAVRSGRPT